MKKMGVVLRLRYEVRLFAMAMAAVGCGEAAAPINDLRPTGAQDAGADTEYHRAACAGPPATLSLGAYPAEADTWVQGAQMALGGTVVTVNQLPSACVAIGVVSDADTFRIDETVWGDT